MPTYIAVLALDALGYVASSAAYAVLTVFLFAAALSILWFTSPWQPASLLIPGGIAMALTGLVLLEQLFRNSLPRSRSALKPLVVGLGGLFACDLLMYSQRLLFDGVVETATWSARGVVNLIIVPLIAVAARRNPDWRPRICLSCRVVFYTTTLIAVGAYLLAMTVSDFLIVRFGGSWGGFAQIVFFAGAALVLVVLLLSGILRTWLRVFQSKHFSRTSTTIVRSGCA